MKESTIEAIREAIQTLEADLRAEAVVADLIDQGTPPDQIQVRHQGAFHRAIRRDIVTVDTVEDVHLRTRLELVLSRNGFYDSLPEGLFHQPPEELPRRPTVSTLVEQYKVRKRQEQEARTFFQPWENAFFQQRVHLELTERRILHQFQHLFNDFLLFFWKIAPTLPSAPTLRLIQLLPLAYRLAGDIPQVCRALSYALNQPVDHLLEYRMMRQADRVRPLGHTQLGQSFIAGYATEAYPVVIFRIGPVGSDVLADFLPGGAMRRFIEQFYGYFVPFHVEAETKIIAQRARPSTPNSFGTLTYSFQLAETSEKGKKN